MVCTDTEDIMAKLLAVTHAEKSPGANPGLTAKGLADIKALSLKLMMVAGEIATVLVGTGRRFSDVLEALGLNHSEGYVDRKIIYTPLLGGPDSGVKSESGWDVILAHEKLVKLDCYVGLIGTPGIDLWAWILSLPNGSVLCTGRELIGALGVKGAETGQLYLIDTETKTVSKVE